MEGRQGKEKKKRRRSKEKKKPEGVKIDVDSQDCGWLIVGPKGSSSQNQTFLSAAVNRGRWKWEGRSKASNENSRSTADRSKVLVL
jgi:hypothetical protein